MPIQHIDETNLDYYLILHDDQGHERPEADGKMLSDAVRRRVGDASEGITDVFFISHGWKGDVPAAIEQYDDWVNEMGKCAADRDAMRAARPGFKPLIVGLHWPSLPFGDEEVRAGGKVLGADAASATSDDEVDRFARSIADTGEARDAIRTILDASRDDAAGDELPAHVLEAYERLYEAANLGAGSVSDAPGREHEHWDPKALFQESQRAEARPGKPGLLDLRSSIRDAMVAPLRQLSFWKMKDRARRFGESGAHDLLLTLQAATPDTTHFHLMGHSFGCIVVSAAVAGPVNGTPLLRPVDSLFLVQGALSLWSFSGSVSYADGKPGYFNRIVKNKLVRGPIVTTRSLKDTAVRGLYPKAASLAKQTLLAPGDFPKYGGVGTFGAQGLDELAEDAKIQHTNYQYKFAKGRIYNLDAVDVIKNGGGFSGAHSDIAHPEVAHIMWQMILTSN
jgi:hypothetical protein